MASNLKMYSWDSEALADYYAGTVAVLASNPREARAKAKAAFRKENPKDFGSCTMARFEADLAVRPEVSEVLLIPGGS
ncbi:MAG: hypothetical protein JJ979_02560 [Roseibium sp.]|nr:hypothetical protein [Roseibium sp.]